MKKQERLFLAIGNIDPTLLAESEVPRRPKFVPIVAACACLLLVFGIAAAIVPLLRPKDPIDVVGPTSELPTSEKYSTLSELLSALSIGEDHGKDELASVRKGSRSYSTQMSSAAVYSGYSYHISEDNTIAINKLDGDNTKNVGKIEGFYSGLLVYGEYLAAFSVEDTSFETGEAPKTIVKLFDLSNPAEPQPEDNYELGGTLRTAFSHNGKLYVLHSDGVCACGWSRAKDENEYKPAVCVNGETFTISDAEISVLGTPVRVEYTAVTCIGKSGEHISTRVLYGNIDEIYVLEKSLIFSVVETDSVRSSPAVLYKFEPNENGIRYLGCIYLADALGIDRKGTAYMLSGSHTQLKDVSEQDGALRLIGEQYDFSLNELRESSLFCITVLPDGGIHTARSEVEKSEFPISIDELIYDEDCIVFTYSAYNPDRVSKNAFLSYITLDESTSQFSEHKLEVPYIDGIDGYMSVGRPYGELYTMIELGEGKYLRTSQDVKRFELIEIGDEGIYSNECFALEEGEVCMLKTVVAGETSAVLIGEPYFNGESYRFWGDEAKYWYVFFDRNGKEICRVETGLDDNAVVIEYGGEHYFFSGELLPAVLPITE